MPTATETDRAREMRLRRHAKSRGLILRKRRRMGSWPPPWSLSHGRTGRFLCGDDTIGKTLDEIERFINEGNWMP